MKSVWDPLLCLPHPTRPSTGPFTRRALRPAMAVRRPLTLDTTPAKRATRTRATLPPAATPDPSPLAWGTSRPNRSSRSGWKTRRCGASRVSTLPLMLPSPAAARRTSVGPRRRPKPLTPDDSHRCLRRRFYLGRSPEEHGWKGSCYDDGRTLFLRTDLRTLCV